MLLKKKTVLFIYIGLGGRFFYYQVITSFLTFKKVIMRSILYIIAVILVIGWLLGVFVYSAKGLIHILLVLAIISLLIGVIRRA
jgi:Family of unknown function (DUF5670)